MPDNDTDVCVVGAGPAGLALTLLLLRSGVRVTLVEPSTRFDRDFRGEILQPGGQVVLDALDVLDAARAQGACDLDGFQLVDRGRVLLDIDYRRLPPPYDRLLAIPQRHVLGALLDGCRRHAGFRYLDGHRISSLLEEGGRYVGAVCTGPTGPRTVRCRVVVGADGRYSKTRRLSGIDAGRLDLFDQDVLWFRLRAPGRLTRRVRVHRTDGSPVLVHDSYPDRLQIGWTLPHRGWSELAGRGIDAVRRELVTALPQYADLIDDQVRALSDLKLLDVFAAQAEDWVRDGLVLIGDSAHTHSPLGAQGINLALQDAAVLHPVLLTALAADDTGAARLRRFADLRGPAVSSVLKMQRMQAKGMLGRGSPVAEFLRPKIAGLINRTPIGLRITDRIAYGPSRVRVRTDLFTTGPVPAENRPHIQG